MNGGFCFVTDAGSLIVSYGSAVFVCVCFCFLLLWIWLEDVCAGGVRWRPWPGEWGFLFCY